MDIIPQKQCSKCGELFPQTREFFSTDKTSPSGLRSYCKPCGSAMASRYYHANREKVLEQKRQHRIDNIEQYSERERVRYRGNPEKEKARWADYRRRNPEKRKKAMRSWYERNIDRVRLYTERYYSDPEHRAKNLISVKAGYLANRPERLVTAKIGLNRRRARIRQLPNTLTIAQWRTALEYFNHSCAVCRKPFDTLSEGQFIASDHWIPLSDPNCPGTVAKNAIPLCHGVDGCNNKKKAMNPIRWLIKQYGADKAQEILDRINAYFDSVVNPS